MAGLDRFVEAQTPMIETVLAELRAGQKRTHWMWFIFPQLRALGHSQQAKYFGIENLAEAQTYIAHAVLGPRLIECTEAAMSAHPRTAHQIFGSPDDLKFRSCMTLFSNVEGAPDAFRLALNLFNDGPDAATLDLL